MSVRALVTGGTGFLGRRVVAELLCAGATVRCLVRPSSRTDELLDWVAPSARPRLEFVRGELTHAESCAAAVDGCDTVFHLAAEMSGATAVLFLANVVGTRRLVSAALDAGASRFVLVSSIAVYNTGSLPIGGVVDERCPLDPMPHQRDAYTYSKVRQEEVAWEAHRSQGLPLVVVRPGVIYGPGKDCLGGRVGLRLGRWILVMSGRLAMPYTYVDNCAVAVVRAGVQPGVIGQAFNVVDDEVPTGRELARRYRREIGGIRRLTLPGWAVHAASWLCESYHKRSRGQLPAVLTRYKARAMWRPLRYSNRQARDVLGWAPARGLADGLRESFDWLRANARRA